MCRLRSDEQRQDFGASPVLVPGLGRSKVDTGVWWKGLEPALSPCPERLQRGCKDRRCKMKLWLCKSDLWSAQNYLVISDLLDNP